MKNSEVIETIRDSVFFKCIEEAKLPDILSVCSNETWQKGRSTHTQSTEGAIYFIVSGYIKSVRIDVETGRSVTLFLLGPGDSFDLLQLLHGPSDETIFEALTDVSLLRAPKTEVVKWLVNYPEFNKAILPYLGEMIVHLEDLASSMALHDTETRLARLIVKHLETGEHNGVHLINDMNHENLAQMIGSVRAVVNRQLHHWREAGVIATNNGKIQVKNLEVLLKKIEAHMPWAAR